MKDVIYLTVNRQGVQNMRKSYPGTKRGESIVKLSVEVPNEAFCPPVLEQHVVVNDWREGIDLEDVKFEQNIITKEEAEMVKQKRLAKMQEILESQGFIVSREETEE